MPRPAPRLLLLAAALLLAAPAAALGPAPTDPLRLQLFGGVDRRAVEVGGVVRLTLEVLAAPATDEARAALLASFEGWDLAGQLGPDFEVVGDVRAAPRVGEGATELERRVGLRVLNSDVREVPALRFSVAVGGREVTVEARPQRLWAYDSGAAAAAAGRSVVAVTAEGEVDGVGFDRIGSAFLVGDDALVTAYHVVVGARGVRVRLPDGRDVRTDRAWALDPVRDVAVLHLDAPTGLRPLTVAPPAATGAVAFTAGWPARAQAPTVAARFEDLVLDDRRLRLTANAVRPGDSGGPLLDERGRVLGVVVSGRSTGGDLDLLEAAVCLAADPMPALRLYAAAAAPVPLDRALREAARHVPAAQAHAAVGGLQAPAAATPADREADRQPHVAALVAALRQAPRDASLQYLAGTALEGVGEPSLAAGALDAAWRAGYVPAGYSLGHHLLRQGDLEAAAGLFAALAENGAYAPLGTFGRAQALVGLGRFAEAEALVEAVLDHDARFAPALYLLGLVRLEEGRTAEAEALLVRLAERPEWAGALRGAMTAPPLPFGSLEPLPRVALR